MMQWKVSLLFLLLQLGAQQLVLHHLAVLNAVPHLVLVQLLPQLDLPIEIVFDLLSHQLTDAFLIEGVLCLAVEFADLLRRIVPLLLPPITPVIGLGSVKYVRYLGRVLQGVPRLPFLRVGPKDWGELVFLTDGDRGASFEAIFQSLMKVSRVDAAGHPRLAPLRQLK